jgi:mono/diheme cytochrome c family protein
MGKSTGVVIAGIMGIAFAAGVATAAEKDIKMSRVPAAELQKAKDMKNPLKPTPDVLAKGKAIFEGKGTCFTCHGNTGKGDGPAGAALDPSPRNFTNPEFNKVRTPGEMFWVVKNGSPGTGMIAYNPAMINDDETWEVITYVRSLGGEK